MSSAHLSAVPREAVPPVASADLRRIAKAAPALLASTPVLDVGELMLGTAALAFLSLPVVVEGRPIGAISRHELMRVYLMPFGRELYGRRPITALMSRTPLVLSVATSLEEAARQVAARIASPITEDFVIVEPDGHYLGMGAVLDLLRAVESRLSRRGHELERAHANLRSSQMQLVQSEKMASLGQMVAGLVHEINTPLGYVANNVEMTRATLGDATQLIRVQERALAHLSVQGGECPLAVANQDEIHSLRSIVDDPALDDLAVLLDDTLHGIAQIADLVGNLKDFSRLDQASLQTTDVNQLVASALRIVQHLLRKRNIDVATELAELPGVECAPAQINQVLLNLLSNAAQAIDHDAGRITVRTQSVPKRICVIVEDNGKGIAAEHLGRIFDPFFTTKAVGQGTGLGLAIAHQIVDAHGGLLRVASKVGVGTRFMLVLPTSAVAAA